MSAKKSPKSKNATAPKLAVVAPLEEAVGERASTPKAKSPKAPKSKAARSPRPDKPKLSALDAAAKVLADAGHSMTCGEMIEAMTKKDLWTSPNGATPSSTLYSAILRETQVKGENARFVKTERGKFLVKATK
jgi:hypothetical protein